MDGDDFSISSEEDAHSSLDEESDFEEEARGARGAHGEPAYVVSRYVRRARGALQGAWGRHPHGQVIHLLVAATRAPLMRPLAVLQAALSAALAAGHLLDRNVTALLPLVVDFVYLSGVFFLSRMTPSFVPDFVAWLERTESVVTELEVNVHAEHVRDLRLRMRLGRTLFVFSFCNMGSLVLAMLAAPLATGEAFLGVLPHARGAAFWAEYVVLSYTLVPTALSMVLLQCCHAEAGTKLVAMYRMLHNDVLVATSPGQVRRAARLHANVLDRSEELNVMYSPFLSSVYWGGNAAVTVCALQTLFDGPTARGLLTGIVAVMSYAWLCILGEKLARGSGGVVSAVHRAEWLYMRPDVRRLLAFLLKRAQRCDSVRPRFVGDMTLNFLMNTAISWYNRVQFMHQVMGRHQARVRGRSAA